jgi:hypothetical protein
MFTVRYTEVDIVFVVTYANSTLCNIFHQQEMHDVLYHKLDYRDRGTR